VSVFIDPSPTALGGTCNPSNPDPTMPPQTKGCGDLLLLLNSEMFVRLFAGTTFLVENVLDGGTGQGIQTALPARRWVTLTGNLNNPLGSAGVTALEISFRTYNQPWVGTVYYDAIRIQ
jgi:hypothetical protein